MPDRQAIQVPGLKTTGPIPRQCEQEACCSYRVGRVLTLLAAKRPVSPLTFKLGRRSRFLIQF
jgi:hypothetical protein